MAVLLVLALVAEFAYVIFGRSIDLSESLAGVGEASGSPALIGRVLISQYLIPFEVTSILLPVAMVGAIVLTRDERKENR